MASIADTPLTFMGLDVHKDSISAGILEPGVDDPTHDKIFHDETSIRRLVGRFDPATLKVFYEAEPTGYGLARLLASMGIDCQVVTPSLIPTAPGDRVKTDRRDARRLARLARAGELTPIRVPSMREEAVRDLCRVRVDAVQERRRARQRLGGFLLRHGRVFREAGNWTAKHTGTSRSRLSQRTRPHRGRTDLRATRATSSALPHPPAGAQRAAVARADAAGTPATPLRRRGARRGATATAGRSATAPPRGPPRTPRPPRHG